MKKHIVKDHFDLVEKRNKAREMPMNSLTNSYIESLGKSEIEKRLENHYDGFGLTQFLNATSVNKETPQD
jgi:hypothetical protein